MLGAMALLGGCGDVDKGSAKGADFERALMQRHGALIEDVAIGAQNALPWVGDFEAKVFLRSTASTADLAAVEAAARELLVDDSDSAVVWANGVEICPTDAGPRTQHLALREGLFDSSAALAGELSCEDGYAGELSDLTADIAVVQAVVAQAPSIKDLRIDGRLSAPRGEVKGLWRELTPRLADALGAVDPADLNSFELDGGALAISVQPSLDIDRIRAAVAAQAPKVVLSVTPGSAHGGAPLPDAAAQLRADVETLAGVESARFVSARQVVVRVAAPTDVAPVVAASRPRIAAMGPLQLHVSTQATDTPNWTIASGADFEVAAEVTPEHLDAFETLVSDGRLSAVGWREKAGRSGAPMVTITALSGGDLRKVLPLVKEHVPVGADLNLHLGDDDYYFDVAARLEKDSDQIRDLPPAFIELWNSLP